MTAGAQPPVARPGAGGSPWLAALPLAGAAAAGRDARLRRGLQHLASLALLVVAGVLVVTAHGPIGRLLRPGLPPAARRGLERVMRSRGYAVPSAGPPSPAADARSPALDGLFAHGLDGELLDAPRDDGGDEPAAGDVPTPFGHAGEGDGEGWHAALARGELVLRDRANPDGAQIGQVSAGQVLVVLRDAGSWLLVGFKQDGAIGVGWAPRSGLRLVR